MSDATTTVIEQFETLQQRLNALCTAITVEDADRAAWAETPFPRGPQNSKERLDVRRCLTKHLGQLWHQEPAAPQRVPGLVACSAQTLAHLQCVNFEKARFEQLIVQLRKALNAPTAKLSQLLGTADGKRSEEIHEVLAAAGMQGVNLTLCYRRFQHLPQSIHSVSWTWSYRSRSIKTLSVREARDLADYKLAGKSTLQSARTQLRRLSADTTLAVVRPVQPALKANIVFSSASGQPVRKLITAHSPLFYLDTGGPLPRKTWPGYPDPDERPVRLNRSRRYLASKPYIKALNLYRYLDPVEP